MPVVKLTKNTIDNIPYTDQGQILYHDQQLKGFMLRVGKNTKTYCVYNTVNRKAKQITIGRHGVFTPEQARKQAKDTLYLMAQGIDPKEKEQKKDVCNMLLMDLLEEFLSKRLELKPNTRKDYRYYISRYLPDWINKPASEITGQMFLDRYLFIGKNNGKSVANNVRRYGSSLFNYAIAAHEMFDVNPVELIKRTRSTFPDKRRDNAITPLQLPIWWEAVEALDSENMSDYFKLVLLTGLRRMEACAMKWEHVNFEERTFTIAETKNGEKLIFPITSYLYNLLKQRRGRTNSEWVFPSTGKSGHLEEPKKAVYHVRKLSNIHFTVHDLRRTYLTIGTSLGLSNYALKKLVNHKISHDVTGGYIVLNAEQLRTSAQKIEDYILEKVYERRKHSPMVARLA